MEPEELFLCCDNCAVIIGLEYLIWDEGELWLRDDLYHRYPIKHCPFCGTPIQSTEDRERSNQ